MSPEAVEFVPSANALMMNQSSERTMNETLSSANQNSRDDAMPKLVAFQQVASNQSVQKTQPNPRVQEQIGNEQQPTVQLQQVSSNQSTQSAHSSAISQEPIRYKMSDLDDVTAIFNWLMSIATMTDIPTVKDIRSLRTTITVILGKIRHCRFDQSVYEPIIMARVLRSLTAGMRTAYRLQSLTKGMSFADFCEFLVSAEEMIDGCFKFDDEEGFWCEMVQIRCRTIV